MQDELLKAPFPYFGGKSQIAKIIWQALGQPKHYIEPFFGSGAVLLARPDYEQSMCETINDKDGFIANVWRAIKFAPDEVAQWCDWPVNHVDLNARRKILIANEKNLLKNLTDDAEWFDAKLAGYWIWAASCWIGSGLTKGTGNQIPHLDGRGKGIHTIGKIPHISERGRNINNLSNQNVYERITELSIRLRRVRVVCGEWNRVCGGNWQNRLGTVGIFFDSPYAVTNRHTSLYHHDSTTVANDVLTWAKARGQLSDYRIVIAGYDEHEELLKDKWTSVNWKANGGYANQANKQGIKNKGRETLYFSPHCLPIKKQEELNFFNEAL